MVAVVVDREALGPSARERQQLKHIEALREQAPAEVPQLLIGGERVDVPPSLLDLLVHILQSLEAGEQATLIPGHKLLTTQEAADLLGMSRQYLVRLLEQHKIPFTKTGTHRRLLAADVLRYKQARDAAARRAVADLAALNEDLGLYETTDRPLPEWKRLDVLASSARGQAAPRLSSGRAD